MKMHNLLSISRLLAVSAKSMFANLEITAVCNQDTHTATTENYFGKQKIL